MAQQFYSGRCVFALRGLVQWMTSCPTATTTLPRTLVQHRNSTHPLHQRPITTNSRDSDQGFLRILREEIARESSGPAASKDVVKNSCMPFTVDDQTGAEEVFFCRTYKKEEIKVSCVYQPQELPEDFQQEDTDAKSPPLQIVHMVVRISKGGSDPHVEVQCATDGSAPIISRVAVKDAISGSRELPYDGPEFGDLDLDVQKCFSLYLEARGIDATFGTYVRNYMTHKDQREYFRWLHNVEKFVTT